MSVDTLDLLTRIGCAALAGGAVGMERELRGHPAGIRTHALVATGSALFATSALVDWGAPPGSIDPTRIAAQVVTGIGFIGAGAILRDGLGVRGLTTAATIWMSGALGVGFAAGHYGLAWGALAIVLSILVLFRLLRLVTARLGYNTAFLDIEYEIGHGTIGPILKMAESLGGQIERLVIDDVARPGQPDLRRVHLAVVAKKSRLMAFEELARELQERTEVRSVDLTHSRE